MYFIHVFPRDYNHTFTPRHPQVVWGFSRVRLAEYIYNINISGTKEVAPDSDSTLLNRK